MPKYTSMISFFDECFKVLNEHDFDYQVYLPARIDVCDSGGDYQSYFPEDHYACLEKFVEGKYRAARLDGISPRRFVEILEAPDIIELILREQMGKDRSRENQNL